MRLSLTLEQFALAIGGQVTPEVKAEYGDDLGKIGLNHEFRTIVVEMPPVDSTIWNKDSFETILTKAVRPYEIDGWEATIDKRRSHRKGSGDKYSVSFHRWVLPDKE